MINSKKRLGRVFAGLGTFSFIAVVLLYLFGADLCAWQMSRSLSIVHKSCKTEFLPYEPITFTVNISNNLGKAMNRLEVWKFFLKKKCAPQALRMEYFLNGKEIEVRGTALMTATPAWGGYSPNRLLFDVMSAEKDKDWLRQEVCVAGGLTNAQTDVKVTPKLTYCRKKKRVLRELSPIVFNIVLPKLESDRNILKMIQTNEGEANVLFGYIFDTDRNKMHRIVESILHQVPIDESDELKFELYKSALNSIESVYLDYLRCYAINLVEFDEIELVNFSNSTQTNFPLMRVQNDRILYEILSMADQINATDEEKCLVVLQMIKENKRIKDVMDLEKNDLTTTGGTLLDMAGEKVKREAEILRKNLLPQIRHSCCQPN